MRRYILRFLSFQEWPEALRKKTGWRRLAFAFLWGFLAAFAFPPFHLLPLLWFSFPAVLFLLQGAKKFSQAFWIGWFFSFGFLIPSLYWIAGALFVEIETFWWVLPFAVLGLPALFAFYYALAAGCVWRFTDLKKPQGVVAFGLAWFLADYARGHLFTGFPWDILGYVWGSVLPVLQITSVIGVYGLTLLTAVAVGLPALLAGSQKDKAKNKKIVLASLAFFALIGAWGTGRLLFASDAVVPNVRLRLVQPNLQQANKWRAESREENFQNLLETTFAAAEKPITHIVWPETATAFYLGEDISHRLAIASRLPFGAKLITGAVQRQRVAIDKVEYYNSLIVIDDTGYIVAGYDKFHLVPFGEYMPLHRWLPFRVVTALGVNFTPGDGLKTLRIAGLPAFSPLVCYEAIFPGEVANREDEPQLLINVTNDAWYEGTIGPAQHFMIARIRAIEEGKPLLRAANKGITAVVDGYGRVIARAESNTIDFVDSDLPVTTEGRNIFVLCGHIVVWLMFFSLFWGVCFCSALKSFLQVFRGVQKRF